MPRKSKRQLVADVIIIIVLLCVARFAAIIVLWSVSFAPAMFHCQSTELLLLVLVLDVIEVILVCFVGRSKRLDCLSQ
jgi:hypothetical protein